MSMRKRIPEIVGVVALVLAGGCDTLKIANPNAPDTPHLLASPTSVLSLAEGAMRTWFLTTHGGYGADQYPVLTMSVMARGHVAMWNNFHIRYYTGCTNANWNGYTTATNGTCGNPLSEGPPYPRAAWNNDPAAAARTLAYFARNATDNAAVDWARVVGYGSKGISSGARFDWVIHQDACNTWCDFLKVWSNDMTTMRLHTRVAHMLDAATQPDPWNDAANTQPNSVDKRLGNGAYRGDAAYAANVLNSAVDPVNGGTDYVWTSTKEFGNKTRGAWHQSAIGQIRYDSLPGCGDNPQGSTSPGDKDSPILLAAENDLIWAEGLIHTGGAGAAALINHTRVGRGGLPPAAEAAAARLARLECSAMYCWRGKQHEPDTAREGSDA